MHLLIAVMALTTQANVTPPGPEPNAVPTAQSASVALARDANDRMTIGVHVGESGPFAFLVDTGAERTVISRELADRLKLGAGKPVMLRSVLGSRLVDTVNIPALRIRARQTAVRDAPALSSVHIGADGMLGVDSLASHRVVFDFKARTMEIAPSRFATARMEGETIVVEARKRYGRLLFMNANVDGHTVAVVIDTGSEISIGNSMLRDRLVRGRQSGASVKIETVLGETAIVAIARVRNVEISRVTLQELSIGFADAPIFRQLKIANRPALLLGMNAMRAFDRVSVDFATGKIRFVLPETSKADRERLDSSAGDDGQD